MLKKIQISNRNPNIRLVKGSIVFFVFSCFVFVFTTGFMISEAVSLQKFSKINLKIKNDIAKINQDIITESLAVYKNSKYSGYEVKPKTEKYFVEKSIDSKYTYLFK